jgi:hypothetical protein
MIRVVRLAFMSALLSGCCPGLFCPQCAKNAAAPGCEGPAPKHDGSFCLGCCEPKHLVFSHWSDDHVTAFYDCR